MQREEIEEAMVVMQAFLNGDCIEYKPRGSSDTSWGLCHGQGREPGWDWYGCEYRIKSVKPSINWNHVDRKYVALAIDESGLAYLYTRKPVKQAHVSQWVADGGEACDAKSHASLVVGNVSWDEAICMRGGVQ